MVSKLMKMTILGVILALAFVAGKGGGSLTEGLKKAKARAVKTFAVVTTTSGDGPAAGAGPIQRGPAIPLDLHLLVDQFGYRPQDTKVAVVRTPRKGFDEDRPFRPGEKYEVRAVGGNTTVFSGTLERWRKGNLQASSGDMGWWFDFSSVQQAGEYYVYDVERNVRSATFRIAPDVYRELLKTAVRTFYYQRSGFAKQPPYAEACWSDKAAYLGPRQDRNARDIRDPDDARTERDLSGGWFDAGDTNKYVTFAAQPLHQLLTAYEDRPQTFTDDFNIPESGNGIPDLIDEVRWQVEWLKKMQEPDGSSLLKVGARKHVVATPPSSDAEPRFYVRSCTSSTIALAGMLAHAADVFSRIPQLKAESIELTKRAVRAFDAYEKEGEKETDCDDGQVLSGDADATVELQEGMAATAAIYLFAATGDARFDTYVQQNYRKMQPYKDIGWSRYAPFMGEALLRYTRLDKANAQLRESLLADKRADVLAGHEIYGKSGHDLYRNFLHDAQYHWGSNAVRAAYGNTNVDAVLYRVDPENDAAYRDRALDTLHYFHGVNPFGMVYLTNMYANGATYSANEIFSSWFASGTQWSNARTSKCGPAPGFMPGGPNGRAGADGVPGHLKPPVDQPPQKSYRDWNKAWPDASYVVTEPSNVYQTGYVRLVAAFAE